MHLSDFHVKFDNWPLVAQTDELIIVHRNQLAVAPVMYIGAHKAAVVPIRAAGDRSAVEVAAPWATLTIPTGGLVRTNLTDGSNPLHLVTKIQPTSGTIFVCIASPGEFDAYFKQFATTP
jgi:hypothetical protein